MTLAKRIIPCLDVKYGQVVKGVRFKNHQVVGDIIKLASHYADQNADELVFYDITASPEGREVDSDWVSRVSIEINIPFCVAGGITSLLSAERILKSGADKISINSPAISNPQLINDLVREFGSQCIVVGIDSISANNDYCVKQFTGKASTSVQLSMKTSDWIMEVQNRGCGEIVLNCIDSDGVRQGYDIKQLKLMRQLCHVPLVASGGAGSVLDFYNAFVEADADAALAASVFHSNDITIPHLKKYLGDNNVAIRS